jgi:phenylpropionate dioxygenase-like ring-hydroxylating dioxygenase large terminal subunit
MDTLHSDEILRRIPAARYTEPAWAEREVAHLWPRVWQFACTVDCVPNAGDWWEYRLGAMSAIVVRGQDGVLRAFQNACTHRASPLLDGAGCGLKAIACPFHNWTFDLAGRRGGSGKYDLKPLRLGVWAGMIFVDWRTDGESLEEFLGVVPGELAWVGLEQFTCRHVITIPIACNWKLVMDAFNEVYHIHAVHPQLLPAADDLNVPIRLLDRHSYFEQTFGVPSPRLKHDDQAQADGAMWRAFIENVGHRIGGTLAVGADPASPPPMPPIPEGDTLKDVLTRLVGDHLRSLSPIYADLDQRHVLNDFHYYVFPNLIFNTFAGWFGMNRARPGNTPDTCFFDLWSFDLLPLGHADTHVRPAASTITPEQAAAFGRVMMQDVELLPRLQRGMSQPGVRVLNLTPSEIRIGHMHQTLDRYLGTSVPAELGED